MSDPLAATGLYVHVPFCIQRCAYCDFYSIPAPSTENIRTWLSGIRRELAALPSDFRPTTIFVGGGTPGFLPEAALRELLDWLSPLHDGVSEWSVEMNPGSTTPAKAGMLRHAGVNRISLGAQTFSERALKLLGRFHSPEEIQQAVQMLRSAGFKNVGVDIIFGLPVEAEQSVQYDVDCALALGVEHLSAYALEWCEGTPLCKRREAGLVTPPPEEQVRAEYDWIRAALQQNGFRHYEISNFAKPGRECAHNLLYWSGGEYLGIGPAAHSHWNGGRFGNSDALEWREDFREKLPPEAKARETLVMGLRRLDGWTRHDFLSRTGFDWHEVAGKAICRLKQNGLLVEETNTLRLAPDTWFISDGIFAELI